MISESKDGIRERQPPSAVSFLSAFHPIRIKTKTKTKHLFSELVGS